jgi:hypothetical protein
MNKINKPISVVREEFIMNLANLINTSGLPSYIMEPIIKDIYTELTILTKQQVERDKQAYLQALKENENKE